MIISTHSSFADQMSRVARASRTTPAFRDERVTLAHGAGGKASQSLVEGLLIPLLGAAAPDSIEDSAVVAVDAGRLAFTTDSYVVSPLFFPGGDIGSLAVHGTINDLAMAGARPLCLSVGLVLEEGLDIDTLRRVASSIGAAAVSAGTRILTGDTKVVPRGKADRLFVNTSGIGLVPVNVSLSAAHVRPGDRVLVSGCVGDHGIAVMLAREALELEADIQTDSAPLHRLAAAVLAAAPAAKCFKDPTRGGVATSLNEIAQQANVAVAIDEAQVPVRSEVRAACEILGLDPLHIANEGKMLAIVPPGEADQALHAMRSDPLGRDAAIIGDVLDGPAHMVMIRTSAGGTRVLDMLVGDPLPRIC